MFFEKRRWALRVTERMGLHPRDAATTELVDMMVQGAKGVSDTMQRAQGVRFGDPELVLTACAIMTDNRSAFDRLKSAGLDAQALLAEARAAGRELAVENRFTDLVARLYDRVPDAGGDRPDRNRMSEPASRTRPKGSVPPDVAAIVDRVHRILTNADMQNSLLPAEVRRVIAGGQSCDALPGGRGEFGRDPDNPIPVNGPIGEVLYLSHLRTETGLPLLFHRLGSVDGLTGNVDMYEVMPMAEGARTERLFFSMYHPRKSNFAPHGYLIDRSRDPGNEIYGVNWLVEGFPNALDAHIRQWQLENIGIPLSINKVRTLLNRSPLKPSPPRPRRR